MKAGDESGWYGFGAPAMNEARRIGLRYKALRQMVYFVCKSGWYHEIIVPRLSGGRFFEGEERNERETQVLYYNADLLSQR